MLWIMRGKRPSAWRWKRATSRLRRCSVAAEGESRLGHRLMVATAIVVGMELSSGHNPAAPRPDAWSGR